MAAIFDTRVLCSREPRLSVQFLDLSNNPEGLHRALPSPYKVPYNQCVYSSQFSSCKSTRHEKGSRALS